jgi:DNA-binding winged helix-turn-helix (wHTH) protein
MPTKQDPRAKELYEFGPFRVDPEKETLLRAGEPVPLTPKTFQILLVLVRHSNEVVTKEDLMKAVWPTRLWRRPTSAGISSCCGRLWANGPRTIATW